MQWATLLWCNVAWLYSMRYASSRMQLYRSDQCRLRVNSTMVWKLDACAFSQLRIVPISTVSERTEQTARRTLSLNHNPPWWPQPALALCIRLAFEFQRPSAKQLLFGNSCRDNLFSSLFCFAAQMQFEECERPFELFFEEGKKSACNITRSAWHINFYDKRIRTAQCIQR